MVVQLDVHAALMARVETLSMTAQPDIAWPGKPAAQTDYWLRVTHLPNVPERIAVDGTPLVHRGILQLDLMNELGRHEAAYIERADEIVAHFPLNLRLISGAAAVTVIRSYSLGGRSTGDHWMVPVRIEYITGSA